MMPVAGAGLRRRWQPAAALFGRFSTALSLPSWQVGAATGDTTGAGGSAFTASRRRTLLQPTRLTGGGRRWRGGGTRWRRLAVRSPRGFCLAIAPVTEFEALFQHGDTGIQPVAIAVEGLDRGGQPPGLVLAFLGNRLDLLRLPCQIGCRDLFAPHGDRGLVGEHGQDDRADRSQRPTSRAATARAGRNHPPRPKTRTASRRYFRSRSCQPDCRNPLPCDASAPLRPRRITPQTLTGNAPSS